ncbi:maltase A3-like [Nilaparvata lugens]|uniref:maltase A3-like n=1 Tax=Nilaparvata lugens TaxID=108931 RepID=UPI00193D6681|nr:maltase A3-like [Nilaparvata lugens]
MGASFLTGLTYSPELIPISDAIHFELLTKITPQSDAITILRTVDSWLQSMPEGMWANWVIGNHDNPRVPNVSARK